MIVCGWCGGSTPAGRCVSCGRDAALPWLQRAAAPPAVDAAATYRKRLSDARRDLEARGLDATIERIAEALDVSPRTVRRWQQLAAS